MVDILARLQLSRLTSCSRWLFEPYPCLFVLWLHNGREFAWMPGSWWRIISILKDGNDEGDRDQYFNDYEIKEGHLYRKTSEGSKWVEPRNARWGVLRIIHDESGHQGTDRTLAAIRTGSHGWGKLWRSTSEIVLNALLTRVFPVGSLGSYIPYLKWKPHSKWYMWTILGRLVKVKKGTSMLSPYKMGLVNTAFWSGWH